MYAAMSDLTLVDDLRGLPHLLLRQYYSPQIACKAGAQRAQRSYFLTTIYAKIDLALLANPQCS